VTHLAIAPGAILKRKEETEVYIPSKVSSKVRLLALVALFILGAAGQGIAGGCTHYASPAGTGNGSSTAQPFKISSFWPVAKAGYTLCLLDGQYTGATSMINPPQNLSGTASAPITVRALNDGKVRINGQNARVPVELYYNNYFVIEGINASNSVASVVSISKSNNNIVRRVAAWDAADGNHSIFGIHGGSYNLLEDVAGWGIARKIYESSQGGNYTTIRRAWGRWEGSHVVGPKMTYTLAYNNYNMLLENAIGTWSGERIKENYVLLDYYGKPWTGKGAGTYTDYRVDQPYGIFGNDGFTGTDKNARTKLLGSLAYVRGSDRFPASQAIYVTKIDAMEIAQTVAYIQPGTHTNKKPFALYNLQTAPSTNLVARNNTAIGGTTSYYGTEWKKSAVSEASSLSAIAKPFAAAAAGANLCFRYHNGALTTQALWPWPMNQRIIDATVASGRAAVDVTATVESMLGEIPSACKATKEPTTPAPTVPTVPAAPSAPSAPGSLKVAG
jgi:hypothetical protein